MLAHSLAPLLHGALGRTASSVDLTVVRMALATTRRTGRRARELDERIGYYDAMGDRYASLDAAAFYAKPPAIRPLHERVVQRLPGGKVVDISWSSGYEPRLPEARDRFVAVRENGTAHARLFRHDHAPSGAVVWIHGFRGGPFAIEQRMSRVRDMFDSGLDVALFTMPFHGLRAPLSSLRAPLFPDPASIELTNEGFGQAIWDVRGLMAWMRARHSPEVGVVGMSLGGYAASLLATIETALPFVVPFVPLADITDAVVAHDAARGVSVDPALIAASRHALDIHRPLRRASTIPPARILVVGAEADKITGRAQAESLATHFGAEAAWFRGGHILQYGRRDGFRRVNEFIARRTHS